MRTGPEISAAVDETVTGWREWSELHQSYQGPWRDLVHHSGRVLQALSYQPTGAIVAAPTTSLPEQVGGERNWDYRYSWVRDASMTMQALWVAACPDEAYEFFDFMASAAAGSLTDRPLQIMFGIGGEHDLSERTLPHLSGWRDSAPGPRRERRLEPAAARRLRRTARRRRPAPRPARRAERGHPRLPRRPRRLGRRALAPARQRHLGGARRAPRTSSTPK